MEALAADKGVTFMERGLPFAFITTRAPGLMMSSSGTHWTAAGGVFGEPVGNANTAPAGDEGYGVVGRVTYAPFSQDNHVVHFGLGYVYREPTQDNSTNVTGAEIPHRAFPQQARVERARAALRRHRRTRQRRQLHDRRPRTWHAVGRTLVAERISVDGRRSRIDNSLTFDGWYSQIAYTLTGEPRPYKTDRGIFDGIRPNRNFGADGWGAFEIAVRLSDIDLSDENINGGEERQRRPTR